MLSSLLAADAGVEKIICADARTPKQKLPAGKKLSFFKLDLSKKKDVAAFVKKHPADVVVNAALPEFNKIIIASCLAAKTNYLDLASYWDLDPSPRAQSPYKVEQLDYDNDFQAIGRVGLINAGVSPGITNLLAAEAVSRLDKTDSIKIRLIEEMGSDALAFSWSKKMLLDEVNWKPIIYRNGKFIKQENFSNKETFEYPKPFGKKDAYLLSQEEIGTIPNYLPVAAVDIKTYDNHMSVFQALVKLGLVSEDKIQIKGVSISPFEFLCQFLPDPPNFNGNPDFANAVFAAVIEASGKKSGRQDRVRLAVVFPKQSQIDRLGLGGNFISYPTALGTYLLVKEIPQLKKYGVYPPEAIDASARARILAQLKKQKIFFSY